MKFLTDFLSTVATHTISLYNQINESGVGQGYMDVKHAVRGFLGSAFRGLLGLFSGLFTSKSNTASSNSDTQVDAGEPVAKNTSEQAQTEVALNPNSMTYALNYFRSKEAEGKLEQQEEALRIEQLSRGKGPKVD